MLTEAEEDGRLAPEVIEERGPAEASARGDLLDRGLVEPPLAKQLHRGLEERSPGVGQLAAPEGCEHG